MTNIIEAQRKRDVKEAILPGTKGKSRKYQSSQNGGHITLRAGELEAGRRKVQALGLEDYCYVLQF
jgi:hypothetical protein